MLASHARSVRCGVRACRRPLFAEAEAEKRLQAVRESIEEIEAALRTLGTKGLPWDPDIKASDDFLVPLFRTYFGKLGLPNLMQKKNFYELADYVPEPDLAPEIADVLDVIAEVVSSAMPAEGSD